MQKIVLSGNESFARAAYEAGVTVAADPLFTFSSTGLRGGLVPEGFLDVNLKAFELGRQAR